LQALIAARLDALSVGHKQVLSDAAVIGKVFWAGAVERMSGRVTPNVSEALHDLSSRELIRATPRSSLAGESEFSFWHVLVRDVAYAQIPRASRLDKHLRAASWIEDVAGDRVEVLAVVCG